ncbi:MAG TPA: ComEC/Rec2 family competence protein, partial [Longimicrobiales bacterium]|nr:ComEC/Rec2 family competence protein [Longimicrobiales bacterium]
GLREVRWPHRLGVLGAGAAAAVLCAPVVGGVVGSGTVEVRVLDVGQGDAVAIRSPAGRWILVDTGPEGFSDRPDPHALPLVRELGRAGVRRVEVLVLTHAHLDHIGGAPAVMATMGVAAVADPGWPSGSDPYVDLLRSAAGSDVPWVALAAGDRLELDGVSLRVVYAGGELPPDADPNATSVVLLLHFGLFSALLTGDAPASVEEELAGEVGPLDLLKVAHHGSRTSSSAAFLRQVHPGVAVISAGRRNRFGHPHPEVLERLRRQSGSVFRTDRDGPVSVVGHRDGRWEVSTGRGRRGRRGRRGSSD